MLGHCSGTAMELNEIWRTPEFVMFILVNRMDKEKAVYQMAIVSVERVASC